MTGENERRFVQWWSVALVAAVAWVCCRAQLVSGQESDSLLISQETTVSAAEPQTAEFQGLAAVPGGTIALEFEARGESDESPFNASSGSSARYLLKIRINGKEVKAATDRLQSRLRNKPPTEEGEAWHRHLVGWRVPMATEFPVARDERYWTVVEVETLLQPANNRIEFSLLRQADRRARVHLRNIRLVKLSQQPTAERFEFAAEKGLPELRATPDGDLAVHQGGLDFALTTSLGHPGGGWIQRGPPVSHWNAKTVPARIGEIPDGIQTDSLRWVRKILRPSEDHLLIEEEITNLGDEETGTMFRIELPFPLPVPNVYLGGDPDPSQLQHHSAANPTVFIPLVGASLGFVAEDDLFRSQMIGGCRPDSGGISLRAERLLLPGKGTVRLRWSLYLFPGSDYFDFINRVRSDWGVRMRIPGSLWWNAYSREGKSDLELQRWLAEQRPFAAVIGSWIDQERKATPELVGLGTGVTAPEFEIYRGKLKRFTARLHALDPRLKVLLYNHYFFNWPEQAPEQFRDSWIMTEKGERFTVPASELESEAPGVYPTTTNSFGSAFQRVLVGERRELGVDGFYFDETTKPGRLEDPVTYGQGDGVTAVLDPRTFAVRQRVGSLPLLTGPYLSRLSQQLLDAQLIAVGNFAPETGEQNRMSWPRFVETDNLRHCPSAHLYSPLAFSYRFEQYTMEEIRERLEQGLVWCVTGPEDRIGIVRHFFPLTPRRLHAGWIEGEERIIAAESGTYGWRDGPSTARLWLFDANGKRVEENPAWVTIGQPIRVEIPQGGIGILERQTRN